MLASTSSSEEEIEASAMQPCRCSLCDWSSRITAESGMQCNGGNAASDVCTGNGWGWTHCVRGSHPCPTFGGSGFDCDFPIFSIVFSSFSLFSFISFEKMKKKREEEEKVEIV